MLVIFAGLPGTGKTTIAQELAHQIGAVYLRIDSIEEAIRAASETVYDQGYRVAYALAEDNLRLGQTVIADSVNPLSLTRNAWVQVANTAGVRSIEVEVQCSDEIEHRRRVETRESGIVGLKQLTWEEVVSREYQPWDHEHVIIETAGRSTEQNVNTLREALRYR